MNARRKRQPGVWHRSLARDGRRGLAKTRLAATAPTDRAHRSSQTGYFLGAELISSDRAHRMIAGILDDIAAVQLQVVIGRTFPLAEAAAAHAYIESRQAFGRVLLKP